MIQSAVVRLVLRLTGACRAGRRGHECDIERAVTAERWPLTAAERDTQMVMIGMSQRTRVVLSEVYSSRREKVTAYRLPGLIGSVQRVRCISSQ
jgi:hypothetical protein